jgi:hypothetical protein
MMQWLESRSSAFAMCSSVTSTKSRPFRQGDGGFLLRARFRPPLGSGTEGSVWIMDIVAAPEYELRR